MLAGIVIIVRNFSPLSLWERVRVRAGLVEKKSPLPTNLRSVPGEGQSEGMSVRQWQKVLRKLTDIGVPHVIFTGGEPTLHSGLTELIRTAEYLDLITGLNTNGRRLAERAFADSLAHAGLSHVQITLESCRPGRSQLHDPSPVVRGNLSRNYKCN